MFIDINNNMELLGAGCCGGGGIATKSIQGDSQVYRIHVKSRLFRSAVNVQ